MLLSANNPSPWTGPTGNNTYLLDGAVPTLIDAGVGEPAHLEAVARALAGRALAQVLITHGHPDHVSGVPALMARWPDLRVRRIVSPASEPPLIDGDQVQAGDQTLRVLVTPGHASDHCCFAAEGDGPHDGIYCGDLIRAGGTIVIAASRGGDLRAYLESLRRVRALAPRRLFPGHGPVIEDPVPAIDAYLRHRAQRESQVMTLLREGIDTPAGIVARIYKGIDPSIEAAAADTVLAHLTKLEAEGRAVREGERWREGVDG